MAISKSSAKQYKVLVNTGKAEDNQSVDVAQGAGDRGQPLRIKAQAGVKYQLQEIDKAKSAAPEYVKVRRVGKDLHITFEDDSASDVIIEDYYAVMPEGYNGVIGKAENGAFYEYVPEDPTVKGLIPELAEGGQAVNVALGGQEVQGAGAALAVFAFGPLLGALGLAGAAAAAVAAAGGTTAAGVTGLLAAASDTGVLADNITKVINPELVGKATPGSTVSVMLAGPNGNTGPYTAVVDANGNYSIKVPANLADGTYTPVITVTPTTGAATTTNGTPFTIDTVPPTIAITADKTALLAGQTTQVTFTTSEAVTDFNAADVQVSGGTLTNFVQSTTDPKVYTATFTPTANSTAASTISVTNGRFSDAASNFNTDGAEGNNNLSIPTNTNANGATGALAPASDSGVLGDNITNTHTPALTGKAPAGAAVKVTVNGVDYTTTAAADGTYTIPQVNNLPDGTYTPVITVTPVGSAAGTPTNGTPFTIDTVPPSIVVSTSAAGQTLTVGQTSQITFTTSEVVSDFTTADVSVTGGTLSNLVQSTTDPKVYTATFTPTSGSTTAASISVASTKFSDAAGNFNTDGAEANNTVTQAVNTVGAPTIAISADKANLSAGQTAIITFTLSDPSSDFVAGDVAVVGGTLSNFAVTSDPKVYKAVFTPTAGSTTAASISVASSTFSNASAVFNTDGADANNRVGLSVNTTTATGTAALAPASDSGTQGDNRTLDNTPDITGTATPLSTVSVTLSGPNGTTFGPFTATTDASGKYSFNVPTSLADGTYTPVVTVTPVGGTAGTPTTGTPFIIDTVTTVAISVPGTAGTTSPISGTSEAGDIITLKDVNGQVIGSTTANASGQWSFTPTTPVPAGTITANAIDVAGNTANATGNTGGTGTAAGKLDPSTDSGVLGDNLTNNKTPMMSGTVPTGSTATVTINGQTYPVTVKPDGTWSFTQPTNLPDGTYSPTLNVTPAGGGTPTSTPITPFTIDTTPPVIAITADKASLVAGQTTLVTFTVSKSATDSAVDTSVKDFVDADIKVTGGTLSNITGSNGVFTATFTPTPNSTAPGVISVASSKFSDAANNFNVDGADVNNTLSLPTNTLANGATGYLAPATDSGVPGDNITNNATPALTGKAPAGAAVDVVINGVHYTTTADASGNYTIPQVSNLPDGTYIPKITVTPTGTGSTPVTTDGTPFTIDTVPPSIIVTSDKAGQTLTTGQTSQITFTTSETVKDFTDTDITVTGGKLSNLVQSTTDPKVYTATFTPTAGSTTAASISVASSKFSDAANNFNTDGAEANNTVTQAVNTVGADTVPPTIAISADKTALLAGQTSIITFTLSEPSSDFTTSDVSVTGGAIGNLVQSTANPLVYTAVYTPTANSTVQSVIRVDSTKFSDASANFNVDGADTNNEVRLTTNTVISGSGTGALAPSSDTGTPGDNLTQDNTPTYSGTAPAGAAVDVIINGVHYTTTADANGQYTINVPTALPDGTYTPQIVVTPTGGTSSSSNGTPFTIDTVAPTIIVSADKSSLTAGQTSTVTFTVSESVTDFKLEDVQYTGGTLSNFQGSGSTYTATFTPTAGSGLSGTVSVASGKFSDAAANFNSDGSETNNTVSFATSQTTPDTTPPTIIVARMGTGTLTSSETISFTLSEASKDFTLSDVTYDTASGTLSNFTAVPTSGTAGTGYTQYTATFTPKAGLNTSLAIGVLSNKFADAAGNLNKDTFDATDSVSGSVVESNNKVDIQVNTTANPSPTPDTTAPTIAVARAGTANLATGNTDTITFTLSENSLTFDQNDVTVVGGTLTNWTIVSSSGSPSTGYHLYTAIFVPTVGASGTATIGVVAGKFTDAANNINLDTYSASADSVANHVVESNNVVSIGFDMTAKDTTPPKVEVLRSGAGTITGAETIYFNFTEATSDFVLGDISAQGGVMSNLVAVAGSGNTQYTATFTPNTASTGTASIGVLAAKFSDASGNLNADTFDTTSGNYEANNLVTAAINTNASPTADTTPPTVAITRTGTGTVTTTDTLVFTFSEPINPSSFTTADLDVSNGGKVTNLVAVAGSNNTQFTGTYTPAANQVGTATIGIASRTFTDVTGNNNLDTYVAGVAGTVQEGNNQISVGFNTDTTAPTITVTRAASGTVTGTDTITFTLSEPSTSFDRNDIDLLAGSSNTSSLGALGALVPDTTSGTAATGYTRYTAVYTAPANVSGDIKIGVQSAKFTDAAGNLNQDSYLLTGAENTNNAVNFSYNTNPMDTVPPTIVVTRANPGATLTGATLPGVVSTETITFELSEASTTFGEGDIDTVGGKLGNFAPVPGTGTAAGGYTKYTATFTPVSGAGTGTVGVLAGKFSDNAGNLNQDSYTLSGVENANNQVPIGYNTASTDTTPPNIAVTRLGSGTLTAGKTETLLFTISELASFDVTSITIISGGGTITNVVPVSGSGSTTLGGFTQYTATYTPPANASGNVEIGVLNGRVTDLSGNNNVDTFQKGVSGAVYESNNMIAMGYATNTADTTPPTIVVSRTGTGTVSKSETILFTLSEASTSFDINDVDYKLGTLTGFSPVEASGSAATGYTQYVATFTPVVGSGTASVGVKAGKFTDMSSNANQDTYDTTQAGATVESNNQIFFAFDTNAVDTVPPVVAVTRATNNVLGVGATEVITFVLSEPSLTFTQTDISYSGGTIGTLTPVATSGDSVNGYTQYTVVFTPEANAIRDAYVGVKASTFTDAKGNLNQDTFDATQAGATLESNNVVKMVCSTIPVSGPIAVPDTNSVFEAGGTTNGITFTDPTGNVLSNDTTSNAIKVVTAVNGTTLAAGSNSITGTYGTLFIKTDGSYSYTPLNSAPAVEALNVGGTLVETFTYTLKDGNNATTTSTLKVTINGTDDAPVVAMHEANQSATIGTAFSYTVPATTFSDVDNTVVSLTYSATLAGGAALPSWLKFDPDTKTFSGTPPAGTAAQLLTLAVVATDSGKLSATDTFTLNVSSNHAPTLGPITSPADITELADASAQNIAAISGTLSVNDVDSGNIITASAGAATASLSGGVSLPNGVNVASLIASSALTFGAGVTPNGAASNLTWTYDPTAANLDWLPFGQTLTISYPVTVSDGQGGTATQNLLITIKGTNDAPVANNAIKQYNKGAASDAINLLTGATDPDTGETATLTLDTSAITYSIDGGAASSTLPATLGVILSGNTLTINPAAADYAGLVTGQTKTIVATYNIKDVNGAITQQTTTLKIIGAASGAPIANNDVNNILEQGGTLNGDGTLATVTDNLLTNDRVDSGLTKVVQDAKFSADTSVTPVNTAGVTINGLYGSLLLKADGTYTYTLDNSKAAVQGLKSATETLPEVFTYTLKDSNGVTSTATLTLTIKGANDAPVAVADVATNATEAGGTVNGTPGTNPTPTGNVLTNDTDVDTGDTKVVSQAQETTSGGVVTIAAGTTSSSTSLTAVTGKYGSLKLGADGSYSYAVDNANNTVQALKNSTDTLTDSFTYTIKDAAGLTSTATLSVTVLGANDAPGVVGTSTVVTPATVMVPTNFGTAFAFTDVDVSTGVMTLTLSSSDTDGKITVTPGTSGASITSGNGTNSVIVSGTLAQLQALTGTASNFTFVNSASYSASHNVTITAALNDNGNLGNLANPLTGNGTITFAVAPDANATALIDITAITTDSGVSATDYITNDNTLVYSGTVTNFVSNGDRVKLELIQTKNPDGTALATPLVIDTTTVDPVNGTWSWNKQSIAAADGTYQLRATIVDANGNRVAPSTTVGSNTGTQDVQAIVIDTNTPNVDPNQNATIDIVSIVDTATDSKDTGTSSTDFTTSDQTLTYKGTITTTSGWDANQGDLVKLVLKDANNAIVATQYVVPTKNGTGADWIWNDTSVTRNANTTYTLEATIVDTSGNPVNHLANSPLTPTPSTNGTGGGIDTQLITISADPPTATLTFSTMSKDSSNFTFDWLTADESAGRIVSGKLSAPLKTGETLQIYTTDATGAKVLIGNAVVKGTDWEITDMTSYTGYVAKGGWTYSGAVSNAIGTGPVASQPVVYDPIEPAPVIAIATVTPASGASVANGDFSGGTTGFTSDVQPTLYPAGSNITMQLMRGANQYAIIDLDPIHQANGSTTVITDTIKPLTTSAVSNWTNGTWQQKTYVDPNYFSDYYMELGGWKTFASLASGKIYAASFDSMTNNGAPSSATNMGSIWSSTANVVQGQTYQFKFDYWNTVAKDTNTPGFMDVMIDGVKVMTTTNLSTGEVTINYTATKTGAIPISLDSWSNTSSADVALDNLSFTPLGYTANVSGTATPNSIVYVYDNSLTNIVGSVVADGNGNWNLPNVYTETANNNFVVKSLDTNGNESVLSNVVSVGAGTSQVPNGNFDSGMTGFTSDLPTNLGNTTNSVFSSKWIGPVDLLLTIDGNTNGSGTGPGVAPGGTDANNNTWNLSVHPRSASLVDSGSQSWTSGTWSQKTYIAPDAAFAIRTGWGTFYDLTGGASNKKILAGSADYVGNTAVHMWTTSVNVVQGQKYTWTFDYWNTASNKPGFLDAVVDGKTVMTTTNQSTGEVTINYTATKTGAINLALDTWSNTNAADFALDNITFVDTTAVDPSLHPGGSGSGATTGDNPALTYNAGTAGSNSGPSFGGAIDALAGDDTITVTGTDLQNKLTIKSNYINGSEGHDILKLSAGTMLDLEALTAYQTVQPIQQIEQFTLQGGSTFKLNANDVLSLGGVGTNALSFNTTSGGSASTSSSGKVQMVIDGTATDVVTLDSLTSNGGIVGMWQDMGKTVANGHSYEVYNHTDTNAQVLIDLAIVQANHFTHG